MFVIYLLHNPILLGRQLFSWPAICLETQEFYYNLWHRQVTDIFIFFHLSLPFFNVLHRGCRMFDNIGRIASVIELTTSKCSLSLLKTFYGSVYNIEMYPGVTYMRGVRTSYNFRSVYLLCSYAVLRLLRFRTNSNCAF